ncbi:unnamed protein product [Sphenostylis stenocarpa]|uniref:Uncharacterized protein n=1 Tax=Sphenostylis stenocarpa TaxID=92480 RepID=A0AA86S746_9FABA|nr:unnamed protein product [Sphenostylis stenocarpa]
MSDTAREGGRGGSGAAHSVARVLMVRGYEVFRAGAGRSYGGFGSWRGVAAGWSAARFYGLAVVVGWECGGSGSEGRGAGEMEMKAGDDGE